MKALDLCCAAGGASRGLKNAGFTSVRGVDIVHQPRYPFLFDQLDVRKVSLSFLRRYDFIWASPPCQLFTAYKRRGAGVGEGYQNLIPELRERLRASGVPYCIENVPGAPLEAPVTLCGSMFGLDVKRHRLFETSWPLKKWLVCNHERWQPRFRGASNRKNLRKTIEIGCYRTPRATQYKAMGIDWMTLEELSLAIPPAYAEYIGRSFFEWQAERLTESLQDCPAKWVDPQLYKSKICCERKNHHKGDHRNGGFSWSGNVP